jgi:hypothetical protein
MGGDSRSCGRPSFAVSQAPSAFRPSAAAHGVRQRRSRANRGWRQPWHFEWRDCRVISKPQCTGGNLRSVSSSSFSIWLLFCQARFHHFTSILIDFFAASLFATSGVLSSGDAELPFECTRPRTYFRAHATAYAVRNSILAFAQPAVCSTSNSL